MAEETRCVLRLYGAPQGRLAAAVALFAPQWRAEAQWKSRGAETLLAVHADTPTGLKKAAQSLRSSFGADVYGAGDTSLAAAAVQALEAHDRLLACGDAAAGALLGGVFGLISFWECFGKSSFGVVLMGINPFLTFLVCVPTRILAGWICGLVFKGLSKLDKSRTWSYIVSAMCAPALNTLFFMGYIVLAFYNCDYVQNLVSVKGAANPLMFVVLLVGVQGVAEFLVSGILGGIVARAVHKFLK